MKQVLVKTGIVLILSCNAVQVQAAPADMLSQQSRIDQIEQQQSAKRQAREERERINAPNVNLAPQTETAEAVQLPKEKVSFLIRKIEIECANKKYKASFNWTNQVLKQYEHHRIGVEGINILAKLLSESIIDKGYVTSRVVIPEQDLSLGTLKFIIIPGTIHDIRFAQDTWGTWRNAFPAGPGKLLNIRDLEQGLEQMKRVPNQDVTMQLVPGTNPGESDVVIDVKRGDKPWTVGLSIDDSGTESTGRLQATANIALYNPTGLNDIMSYSYTKDAEGNDSAYGTKNYYFSYSLPYKDYTFSVSKYRNRFYQTVPSIVPFLSSGQTDGMEISVQKLLYRDRTRKTQGQFKLIKRKRHSFINDTEIEVQRQETTAYQLGLLHRQYWGSSTIDMLLYYQKGMPWWQAEPGLTDQVEGTATTRYSLYGLNLNIAAPVKLGKVQGRYTFNLRGQYTTDVLYGADQFSIGGRYTVRGFDGEQTLSAENGIIIRNELSVAIPELRLEPYLGLVVGHVWGPSDEYLLGKNLAGAVFGIRGNLLKGLQYDAFIGTPIYKPEGFKTSKTALGFQVYYQF